LPAVKKRPCKVCGSDLNMWGPDRKGMCPHCAQAKRATLVPCAGKCNMSDEIRAMHIISMSFEPGVKGGNKYSVYYCLRCFSAIRSRVKSLYEAQQKEIENTNNRRLRFMEDGQVTEKEEKNV